MFETDEGHRVGWDGNYRGEPAIAEIYSYIVEVVYLNKRKVIKKGELTAYLRGRRLFVLHVDYVKFIAQNVAKTDFDALS